MSFKPSPRLKQMFTGLPLRLPPTALLLGLAGCAWFSHAPVINVPVQQTAVKQYRYAVDQRENMTLPLLADHKKLAQARMVVRSEFAMVPENFPNDRRWTPLAKLELYEMDAALDQPRATASAKAVRQAIKDFTTLAGQYPEYDFIQAKSTYDRGICYKKVNEFAQAQACFREVRDKYEKHPDSVIADLARSAGELYNEVYVNE